MRSFAISLLLLPAALTAASYRPSHMQAREVGKFSLGKFSSAQLEVDDFVLQAVDELEI
jgi:hypothetical protein